MVICDECGEDGDEMSANELQDEGWWFIDGVALCPDCADDEGLGE